MLFTSTAATLASAATEGVELPGPAWAFGVSIFGCFMVLLGVLWCFRNTAAKYDTPVTVKPARHGDARGATDHGAHH